MKRKSEVFSYQELELGERGQYLLFNKKRAKMKCTYSIAHVLSEKNMFIIFKKEVYNFCNHYMTKTFQFFSSLSVYNNLQQRLFAFEKQNHYVQPFSLSYTNIPLIGQKCYNNFWLFSHLFFVIFLINNLSSYSMFLLMFSNRSTYN